MNVLGEGFPFEIISQIITRQKVQGLKTRTTKEAIALESNNAWCKLVSSTEEFVNNKNNSVKADSYILFNGVGKTGLTQGVATTNTIDSNTAYGIGGTEFGILPMPGIISAIVTHENRGSLRRAEVKIKAYNKEQFSIIDTLYMRLGYTILLEWGHSMYYIGDTLHTTTTTLDEEFLKGKISYLTFLSKIDKKRKKTQGNYDALLGRISNFDWVFNQDGTYDITVKISSFGNVIESLQINVSLPQILTETNNTVDEKQAAAIQIRAYASANAIGEFLNRGVPDADVEKFIEQKLEEQKQQQQEQQQQVKYMSEKSYFSQQNGYDNKIFIAEPNDR